MLNVREWWANRQYGGQTGLNEMGNNAKMTAIITGPFLGGWILVQLFVPYEYVQVAIMLLFGFWVGYCMAVYTMAKNDALNYRAFPQSTWRFPDGGVRVFNMLIPPDGFEKICDFKDGSLGYHVRFSDKYQYQIDGVPFPYVFQGAFLKVPELWDRAFGFRSSGEFFHKGIAIEHPACENVSLYVLGWSVKEGGLEPVALVNDCSHQYREVLNNSKHLSIGELSRANKFEMLYQEGRKTNMGLMRHSRILEETVEVQHETAKDVGGQAKGVVDTVREGVVDIMKTKEPLFKRIFNFKNLMKAIVFVTLVLLVTHFFWGWP